MSFAFGRLTGPLQGPLQLSLLRCSHCQFWATLEAELKVHVNDCHVKGATKYWCQICATHCPLAKQSSHAANSRRHITELKKQAPPQQQELPAQVPDVDDLFDAQPLDQEDDEDSSSDSEEPAESAFAGLPEYQESDLPSDWTRFHSPFGPPRFPPKIANRIRLYRSGTGRQRPRTTRYETSYSPPRIDPWSTLAKYAVIGARLSSAHISNALLDEDLALCTDPEFKSHSVPSSKHRMERFLRHEVGAPPIYMYTSDCGQQVPFIWPLDAVALLLRESPQTTYHPSFLEQVMTEDWHSWNWFFAWKDFGSPDPETESMLMLKFFLDEFKTGLRVHRQNLDVSMTLAFPKARADETRLKVSLMSVPGNVSMYEVTEAILVPAIQLLENGLKIGERMYYGTAEFLGDSVGLAELSGMKVNTSHYSAVQIISPAGSIQAVP